MNCHHFRTIYRYENCLRIRGIPRFYFQLKIKSVLVFLSEFLNFENPSIHPIKSYADFPNNDNF